MMANVTMYEAELVPLGNLHGAKYNPREMPGSEMDNLIKSLSEFGFVQPVIARREDGLIIGGHQRVEAMRRLLQRRLESDPDSVQVPVVWLDGVSDDKAKLLNLALNRISGEWSHDLLSELVTGLEQSPDLDLAITGFDPAELDAILGRVSAYPSHGSGATIDPDEELRRDARRFKFEVGTDEEAVVVRSTLEAYGMTSPANMATAFLAIAVAAQGDQ